MREFSIYALVIGCSLLLAFVYERDSSAVIHAAAAEEPGPAPGMETGGTEAAAGPGAPGSFPMFAGLDSVLHQNVHLPDLDGVERMPLNVERGQLRALFFVSEECEPSISYASEIRRLCDLNADRGLSCQVIYTDPQLNASSARRSAFAAALAGIPKVIDHKHRIVWATGARTAPEVVLLASDESVPYRGRIDNRYIAPDKARPSATEHDLRDALDEALAGKPVSKAMMPAVGCRVPDLVVANNK